MADASMVEVSGPLWPFAAGFVDDLSRQGFSPVAVRKHVGLLAGLSGWLAAEGVTPSGLSSEVAERFCAARRAAGHTYLLTAKALGPLLGYLRGLGVAPPPSPPACAGPVEELLSRFRRYLEQERGLVPAAARGYVDKVRPFVARFEGPLARRPRAQRTSACPHQAAGQQARPLPPARRAPRIPGRAVSMSAPPSVLPGRRARGSRTGGRPSGEMRVAAATREVPCTAAGACIGPSTALGRRLDALSSLGWGVDRVRADRARACGG